MIYQTHFLSNTVECVLYACSYICYFLLQFLDKTTSLLSPATYFPADILLFLLLSRTLCQIYFHVFYYLFDLSEEMNTQWNFFKIKEELGVNFILTLIIITCHINHFFLVFPCWKQPMVKDSYYQLQQKQLLKSNSLNCLKTQKVIHRALHFSAVVNMVLKSIWILVLKLYWS